MNVSKSFWLLIKSFLTGRTQQVNLRGILSSIQPCPSGVPQGSVISPTLFNVHINDLEDAVPNHVNIDTCKYADDCSQYQIVERGTCSTMQEAVDGLSGWADTNKMVLNPKKTKDMWICFTDSIPEPPRIQINNEEVERVKSFKLLGTTCQNDLKWNEHIDQITYKANKRLYHLRQCRKSQLPTEIGLATYTSKIRPVLEYASPVWAGLPDYLQQEIERMQARSMRILGLDRNYLPSLSSRRELATIREIRRIQAEVNHPCHSLLPDPREHPYELRQNNLYTVSSKTERHKQSFDDILNTDCLERYAAVIHAKGSALSNCFGFVDGTVRPICRPNVNQRQVYNGHKRVHALKFQSVAIPNGLIANLYGPMGMLMYSE